MKTEKLYTKLSFFATWIVIPGLLILFWVGFSLFFTSKYSVTVLASPHDRNAVQNFKTSELLAGQKIIAGFTANENNLGIVSVRFYNFERISTDSVVFRLKEKNQQTWLYENTYKVNQFQPDELFTFGFPIIPASQGRSYVFEIESLGGTAGNAIGLSNVNPPFVTQYQESKEVLVNDKALLAQFLVKKLYYSFTDQNFVVASLVYLLPFIFYVLWAWFSKARLTIKRRPIPHPIFISNQIIPDTVRYHYILIHIYFIAIFLYILFLEERNGYVMVLLVILWIVFARLFRFESNVLFAVSLFFLLLCSPMILTGRMDMAERCALWVYIFLVIGTGLALVEFHKKPKNSVDYQLFIRNNIRTFKHYVGRK